LPALLFASTTIVISIVPMHGRPMFCHARAPFAGVHVSSPVFFIWALALHCRPSASTIIISAIPPAAPCECANIMRSSSAVSSSAASRFLALFGLPFTGFRKANVKKSANVADHAEQVSLIVNHQIFNFQFSIFKFSIYKSPKSIPFECAMHSFAAAQIKS
jgi:hypothetical protein